MTYIPRGHGYHRHDGYRTVGSHSPRREVDPLSLFSGLEKLVIKQLTVSANITIPYRIVLSRLSLRSSPDT